MRKRSLLIGASAISLLLSGCVLTVHDDDNGRHRHQADWQATQTENREFIQNLKIGADIVSVTDALGGAEDSEGFMKNGKNYIVLFYRTHHRKSDGNTTADETTPLVFEEGKLIGWGFSVLQSARP